MAGSPDKKEKRDMFLSLEKQRKYGEFEGLAFN